MKKIIILMFVLFGIMQTYASEDMVMCTMDAKQCSDWSWVGRTGPNCEFVCPGEIKKMHSSWDADNDGINDCEKNGTCDDSVDYTLPKQKACTREYMPVCAEVQVQCIKEPCYPVKETFSNKCEMENNSLATFLHEWSCDANENTSIEEEDAIMCPMNYMPVCWNDGQTYGNTCMAQKVWVQYDWICVSSKYQKAVYKAWQETTLKHFSKSSEIIIIQTLERVIKNAEKLASKENFESQKWAILNYILHLAKTMLHENIYEKYIEKNISTISPVKPVLWGKWYVTKITWLDTNTAKVEYEDGHIVENMKINISLKNGNLEVIDLEKRVEIPAKFDNKDMIVKLKVPTAWEWKYSYNFINPWVLQFSFNSNGEWNAMLFNINIHTKADWEKQEKEWLFNITKLSSTWDYVISYSHALDVPFFQDNNVKAYSLMFEDMQNIKETIDLIVK